MILIHGLSLSVLFALGLAVTMIAMTVFIVFFHDRKHEELDKWVEFSFSGESLRQALDYYRFMAIWMLFFYVFFTSSCIWLQASGYTIFADSEQQPLVAGPMSLSLFTLDLVLRGGFFDVMQHFDLRLTHLFMNRSNPWFVWYAFAFRMFYSLTMFKILFSFVWIYGKIRLAHQAHRREAGEIGWLARLAMLARGSGLPVSPQNR